MSTPRDLERLAKAVKARRLEVHPSRLAAAKAAGVSKDTWQRVEEGRDVRDVSYTKMDSALGWASGSCIAIAEGGDPVLVHHVGAGESSAMVSHLPAAWLEEELQEVIQSSAMATTPNLTVREIRDLNAKVVEELRRRGILPSGS